MKWFEEELCNIGVQLFRMARLTGPTAHPYIFRMNSV